ncbi:MAG: hypothetical protein HQL40_04425 [Alphaproteobacteria bacterium]|nr:hypothetical protein [Alphaproteobacteria bacterium]
MEENRDGLSQRQIEKIRKPYAHNTAPGTDFHAVARSLRSERCDDDDVWAAVSTLLATAQE